MIALGGRVQIHVNACSGGCGGSVRVLVVTSSGHGHLPGLLASYLAYSACDCGSLLAHGGLTGCRSCGGRGSGSSPSNGGRSGGCSVAQLLFELKKVNMNIRNDCLGCVEMQESSGLDTAHLPKYNLRSR